MDTQQNQQKNVRAPANFLVASPYSRNTPYDRAVVMLIPAQDGRPTGILLDDRFRKSLHRQQPPVGRLDRLAPPRGSFPLRVISWDPEDLLVELELGLWFVTPVLRGDLTHSGDLWVELVRRVGRNVLNQMPGIDDFPVDPTVN